MINIGDYVTRNSHNNDIIFKVIKKENNICTLKGIEIRLIADAEENDLIKLKSNELKILTYLVKNKNKIVSRDDLMNYLWDTSDFIDDNTLTVNINRLRVKLDAIGYKNSIVTKRGQGYILL